MIVQRLQAIRSKMAEAGIDAYIIPSTDPHQSEYVADHWQARRWISGFNGSAGTVVIFADEAGLWTDSRYFLQAENELAGSGIMLHKMVNQFEAEYADYCVSKLKKGQSVAIDGLMWSQSSVTALENKFQNNGIPFRSDMDLISPIWENRPALSKEKILIHEIQYTGLSASDKINKVREKLQNQNLDYHFISALDDIAWLFNVRGRDVDYNPVAISYALIGNHETYLFLDESKTDENTRAYFAAHNITLKPYVDAETFLSELPSSASILIDPSICSASVYNLIPAKKTHGTSLPKLLKSIKNETEAKHIRHAMAKDGAALANTFYWLENTLEKNPIVEYDVLEKLAYYRSQQPLYFGESFGAIVGYRGNGAIIHYAPPAQGSATIQPNGILLVDSGGQYLDGTTDITRTFTLDSPTDEAKKHYTLILKGLIALSKIIFPKGTSGGQLDTLARQFLWENGLNYLHGTGHGVGYFLNVHEPPQGFASIASERGRTIMEPGMLTSNEPGHYIPNVYGMRLENLVLCTESDIPGFLAFETVTLYPFALDLIHQNMLTPSEIMWLNDYQEQVWDKVSPLLSRDVKEWFREKCRLLEWHHD